MSYLMAQDTLNGAEGKITITRNGRILEAAGMRNIKTIAGIQTSDMKTIGTRKVQKKANGVTQTGTGNVYFGSNGSNLFTDMVLNYIENGVQDMFDITITNEDPTSSVGAQVMGYYGCVLTGDIPLSILDDEEAMLNYDFNFSYTSVKPLERFSDPANLGSN
nr:MAG TPA: tail tube protein [Caudoviricetes sp.]